MTRLAAIACVAIATSASWRAWAQPAPAPAAPEGSEGVRFTDTLTGITPVQNPGQLDARIGQRLDEPPVNWTEWQLEGTLVDPADIVRAFLASEMKTRSALNRQAREDIARFCIQIGYELIDVRFEELADGLRAVLVVEPVTLVRHVKIAFDDDLELVPLMPWPPWEVFSLEGFWLEEYGLSAWRERGEKIIEKVFEDELIQRMGLREGSRLARDPDERADQLQSASDRIADYLRNEGYFGASVGISATPSGPHAAELVVDVRKGPRYRIGRVNVEGNNSVPTKDIVHEFIHGQLCLPAIGCLREPRFSRQALNRDVEKVVALYQRRGFPAVRVTTDFDLGRSFNRATKTVDFRVTVNERRKLDVVFEGNSPAFPDSELRDQLTFNEEGSYDDVEVIASAAAIRRFYQSSGFFQASVAWQRERFRFFERLVFSIDEGPRLEVRRVSFEGNRAASSSVLASQIKTKRYSRLFGSGGYVTSVQLEQDVQRIADYYRKRGYADVAVRARLAPTRALEGNAAALAAAVAAGTAGDGLYVRFIIEEGTQRTIEQVTFQGASPERVPELAEVSGLRVGAPFYAEMLDDTKKKLERYYFRRAHPHAVVEPDMQMTGAHGVRVVFRVDERQPVRFGKVLIRGNFKTKDSIIIEELGFGEDAPLTLGRAERGQQNLRASGLFSSVQVDFLRLRESKDDKINVIVNVRERYDHLAQVVAASGYSSDNGVVVEATLDFPNIGGRGVRSELRGQVSLFDEGDLPVGQQLALVETKLIIPHWMPRRLPWWVPLRWLPLKYRSEVTAFLKREDTERFGQLTSYGSSMALSFPLSRQAQILVRYDLRQRNRDEDLVRSAGISDDVSKAPLGTRTGAIGLQAIYDARKSLDGQINPLTPETGFRVEARATLADRLLLGQDRFVKLGFSGQHFWKLGSRVLVSNGLRYDHGIPLGGDVALPEVERFFGGGDTTVRGFEEDRLATEIIVEPLPPLGDVEQLRVLPAGGNIRLIHNLDLQIELWRPRGIPVASAVFLDTGIITNSLAGFKPSDLRHALGLALARVVIPFGSISAEYAVPLDPQLGDDPRGRFHFNFGLQF